MLKSQPSQKNIKGSFEVDKIFSVQCNATRRLIHCLQHMQEMEVSDDASTTLRSGSPPGYPPSTSCRASIHHRCRNSSHRRCRRSCGRSSRYPTTHPPPHCHRQHWTTCHLPRCPRHRYRWRGWRSQMTHPPHSTRAVTVSAGRHVISLAFPAIAIVGGDGDLR